MNNTSNRPAAQDTAYLVEEAVGGHSRATAVTVFDDRAIVSVNFDDVVSIQMSLDELKFLARAANTLPHWLTEADDVQGPDRRQSDPKEAKATPSARSRAASKSEADEAKPKRHGQRWNDDEDRRLLDAYLGERVEVRELVEMFERSPSSIVSRLLHLDAVEVRRKG